MVAIRTENSGRVICLQLIVGNQAANVPLWPTVDHRFWLLAVPVLSTATLPCGFTATYTWVLVAVSAPTLFEPLIWN